MIATLGEIVTPRPEDAMGNSLVGYTLDHDELSSASSMGDANERLLCLMKQEEKHYLCYDYLTDDTTSSQAEMTRSNSMSSMVVVEEIAKVVTDLSLQPVPKSVSKVPSAVCVSDLANDFAPALSKRGNQQSGNSLAREAVSNWRQQMLDWSNLVVDSFGIDREVVSIAFNLLDRYVAKESATTSIPITREDFQLFCMTCLYTAIKMSQSYPRKLSVDCLVDMSRGYYTKNDILVTEREILQGLNWFVNPPTELAFCTIFWSFFPLPVTSQRLSCCQKFFDMATADTFFISKKASLIGLSTVLLVAHLEGLQSSVIDAFVSNVSEIIEIGGNKELDECYEYLKQLYLTKMRA